MEEDDKDTQLLLASSSGRGIFKSVCAAPADEALLLPPSERWAQLAAVPPNKLASEKADPAAGTLSLSEQTTLAISLFSELRDDRSVLPPKSCISLSEIYEAYLRTFKDLTATFLDVLGSSSQGDKAVSLADAHGRMNAALLVLVRKGLLDAMRDDDNRLPGLVAFNIGRVQESRVRDVDGARLFLYHELQTVTVLAAYLGGRKCEAISVSCKLYEQCLSSSAKFEAIYSTPIPFPKGRYIIRTDLKVIASCAGHKSFALLAESPEKAPEFTLVYVTMYYSYKILRESKRGSALFDSVLAVLNASSGRTLNETLICIKFLFRLLLLSEDPRKLISKHELPPVFLKHICGLFKREQGKQQFSTKMFRIICHVSALKKSAEISAFCDELVIKLQEFLEDCQMIASFREHMVSCAQYLSNGHLLRFLKRHYVLWTPFVKSFEYQREIDRNSDKKLIKLLIQAVAQGRKEWTMEFYRNILEGVKEVDRMFHVLKILYCTLRNEVLDSAEFYDVIMAKKCVGATITTSPNEKAEAALFEVKALDTFLGHLLGSYNNPSSAVTIMLENFVLILCQTSAKLCEPESFEKFHTLLKLYFDNPRTRDFFLKFFALQLSALRNINSRIKSESCDKSNYLPMFLLESAISQTAPELLDLVNAFLESGGVATFLHQTVMGKSRAAEKLYRSINENPSCEMVCKFFGFLKGVMYRHQENKARLRQSDIFAPKALSRLLKSMLKQNAIPNESLESLLQNALKALFEVPGDVDRTSRFLIKNDFVTALYLSFLHSMMKEGLQKVAELQLSIFMSAVEGSLMNSLLLSSTCMYRALIKILGKCRDNLSAFKRVLDFVTQISLARMQCSGQREFLCLLYELSYRNPACAELTLDSLAQIISSRPQTELFILNGGKQAGIAVSVLRPGSVPAGGYGVFGWLRTERTDQTQTICEAKSMTVFKLAADKGADVELFLENGVFNYAVLNTVNKETRVKICLGPKWIEEDKWHFIEFYHANSDKDKSLHLFINGTLAKSVDGTKYNPSANYAENSMGCSIVSAYVSKQGEDEDLERNFLGEIGALHFVEVVPGKVIEMHQVVWESAQSSGGLHNPKAFLLVNPKFVENNEEASAGAAGNSYNNSVEVLYKETRVVHLIPGIDAFLDIWGMRGLLMFLKALLLSEAGRNPEALTNSLVSKTIHIMDLVLKWGHKQKAEIQLVQDDVLVKLKFLLESLAGRLPNGLSAETLGAVFRLLETLCGRYSQGAVDGCVESLALNFGIWGHSSAEVQCFLVNLMQGVLIGSEKQQRFNKENMIDYLLSCIGKLGSGSVPHNMQNIETLSGLVGKLMAGEGLTEGALEKLLSYVKGPPVSAAFLRIFLEVYVSSKQSHALKSPLIFTLMQILTFCIGGEGSRESTKSLSEGGLAISRASIDSDPEIASKTVPKVSDDLDSILSNYIYLLLTYEWKKNGKELAKKLPEVLGKVFVKQIDSLQILQCVLGSHKSRKEFLGPALYSAVVSFVFGFASPNGDTKAQIAEKMHRFPAGPLINNTKIYIELISKFAAFTPMAKICFLGDHQILSRSEGFFEELTSSGAIFCFASCLLQSPGLEQLSEIYSRLILFWTKQGKQIDDVYVFFAALLPVPAFGMQILYHFLGDLYGVILATAPCTPPPGVLFALISAVYLFEDLLALNDSFYDSFKVPAVISRLLLVLNKTGLLYFSAPGIALSELQSITMESAPVLLSPEITASGPLPTSGRPSMPKLLLREGGVVRILLSSMLIAAKYDQHKECFALAAIKFFLLRDKESKAKLKKCGDLLDQSSSIKPGVVAKKPSAKYTFLDLLLGQDQAKILAHSEQMESSTKIIGSGYGSTLTPRPGKKPSALVSKPQSMFESGGFQILYLATELIHLLQFELFGIKSYAQFPSQDAIGKLLDKMSDTNSHFPFSPKIKALTDLLYSLLIPTTSLQFSFDSLSIRPHSFASKSLPRSLLYEYTDKFLSPDSSPKSPSKEPDTPVSPSQEALTCFNLFSAFPAQLAGATTSEEKCWTLIQTTCCNAYMRLQPNLTFLTVDNFCVLDLIVKMRAKRLDDSYKTVRFVSGREDKFVADLGTYMQGEMSRISVHREKAERDLLEGSWKLLIGAELSALQKSEEQSALGTIYNHDRIFSRARADFAYANSRYQKILAHCPLHSSLKSLGRAMSNPFSVFLKLDLRRDSLGRAHGLKWADIRRPAYKVSILTNMKYLRHTYLKKLMLARIMTDRGKDTLKFLGNDFTHSVMKTVFDVPGKDEEISAEKRKKEEAARFDEQASVESNRSDEDKKDKDEETRCSVKSTSSDPYHPAEDKTVVLSLESVPTFEAEMITIRHATFGRVGIFKDWLVFWSEPRKYGPKYRFSSQVLAHSAKRVCKRWRLAGFREAVVKRFNLIRQSVELYFVDNTSVFFSFFSHDRRIKFTEHLAAAVKGDGGRTRIVSNPENYFLESKFREKWICGQLSNFEYLILLNKYGGRTFNDLGQYPVFPWVLVDYSSPVLDLSRSKAASPYRDLKFPIAAITPRKRKDADEKLNVLVREEGFQDFQFGSHYLPARAVLGYTFRLEPYASLLIRYEEGQDSAARMFHDLEKTWRNVSTDISDNRELIPEFFYSPWFFPNYNAYYFGSKSIDTQRIFGEETAPADKRRIVVDQVVLPQWAADQHYFIEQNVRALESAAVSAGLHEWVNLVFGIKQQDPKIYNLFRELCEESKVKKRRRNLSLENLAEIQEFGTVPIRLFRQLHTERDLDASRAATSIFNPANKHPQLYATRKVSSSPTLPEAVVGIFPQQNNTVLLLVSNSGSLFRLKNFEGKPTSVLDFAGKTGKNQPRKAPFNNSWKRFLYDGQRNVVSFSAGEKGVTLLYSGFYDHTFKAVLLSPSGAFSTILDHPTCEDSMVTCIAKASEQCVFIGYANGVVAKYESGHGTSLSLVDFSADHTEAVTTMDALGELDLMASGSTDGTVVLRRVAGFGFFARISLRRRPHATASIVRISNKGYIVVAFKDLARCYLSVFSVSGELIVEKDLSETSINALWIDESGYQFVAAGNCGFVRLYYELLTLQFQDLAAGEIKGCVTSIAVTKGSSEKKAGQSLVVGLSTGEVYVISAANSR